MIIDKKKVYIVIAILFILLMVFLYKKKEEFEEDTTELDTVQILEECKDMTPNKLFNLFREDITYMTQVFVDNKVPLGIIKDQSYYPKIASLLVKNGIIKCA
jgi:hypothetical protein